MRAITSNNDGKSSLLVGNKTVRHHWGIMLLFSIIAS